VLLERAITIRNKNMIVNFNRFFLKILPIFNTEFKVSLLNVGTNCNNGHQLITRWYYSL
jgi:hypothetical protein